MRYFDGMGKDVTEKVLQWKKAFDEKQRLPKMIPPENVEIMKPDKTGKRRFR